MARLKGRFCDDNSRYQLLFTDKYFGITYRIKDVQFIET